jgi:nicotinamidase-related amidase
MADMPFRVDPAHTALVVVDVQNDFCSPDGSLAKLGHDATHATEMVPQLERLIDEAHRAGVLVAFVRTTHDDSDNSEVWLGRAAAGPGEHTASIACNTGTWGAEFYRVSPQPQDIVATKHRYSAFVGTDLDQKLRTRGIRSLLFTGATTETCVESSLRDGFLHEYFVSLVTDCVGSFFQSAHDASLDVVRRNFGLLYCADDVIAAWRGTSGGVLAAQGGSAGMGQQ